MCSIDFDGRLDFHNKRVSRARTVHRCVVCNRIIHSGERYLSESYKWEGEVGTDRCCLPCAKDRDVFGKEHGGYPFPSAFEQFLAECIDDRDEESRTKWSPMMKRIRARQRRAA
jgi:hypothetical protein